MSGTREETGDRGWFGGDAGLDRHWPICALSLSDRTSSPDNKIDRMLRVFEDPNWSQFRRSSWPPGVVAPPMYGTPRVTALIRGDHRAAAPRPTEQRMDLPEAESGGSRHSREPLVAGIHAEGSSEPYCEEAPPFLQMPCAEALRPAYNPAVSGRVADVTNSPATRSGPARKSVSN